MKRKWHAKLEPILKLKLFEAKPIWALGHNSLYSLTIFNVFNILKIPEHANVKIKVFLCGLKKYVLSLSMHGREHQGS